MKIHWVLSLLLLPMATSAASFDCSKARSSIEKLICSDEQLSRLDESLARTYQSALASPNANAAKTSQKLWLATTRKSCAAQTMEGVANCLRREYDERIFLLSAMSAPKQDILGTYTGRVPVCFVSSGPEGHECRGEVDNVISVTESGVALDVVMELYFFNGHQCNFEGTADWQDGRLLVKGRPEESQCAFNLYSDGQRITSYVSDEMSDACHTYCGARGTLNNATLRKRENQSRHER